jgi:tetratricopeptide (TPR) repeat protein
MTPRPLSLYLLLLTLLSLAASAQPANSGPQAAPQSNRSPQSPSTIQLGKPAGAPSTPAPQSANNSDQAATLAMADRLLANGKAAEAQEKYQAVVNVDPGSVPAQVGLGRALTVQLKLDEAQSALAAALALHPDSPDLLLTLGELQFTQGKLAEAEASFVKAQNLKHDDPAPYLGLARVYRAYSLFRRAYDNMKRAHEVAPNNIGVQLQWFHSLPQADQAPALQAYLAEAGAKLNPQTTRVLQQYLAFVKRNAAAPAHPCKLVSNVKETNTKLYAIPRSGSELGASGIAAKINNQELHLAVDTGATGVLLGRTTAEKLGLPRLGYQAIAGMGDSGQQGGYLAVADRIRIGDLEFQDCTVRVTDAATPVTGQDGLIGTDVFSAYLIDIDIPGAKLRLSPLPKRPNTAETSAALQTTHDSQQFETETPAGNAATHEPPRDAYVAPEMKDWSKVYRFRNLLLVPTKVDDVGPMLFLLDTGSFANTLSTKAAQQITQLRADPSTHVTGLGGKVGQVYRADKATLQFGRYSQANQDIVTFDLTGMSRSAGTQVSGILGFNMLRILQIKIDYRDGLVDFLYDPNRLPKQIKLNKQ